MSSPIKPARAERDGSFAFAATVDMPGEVVAVAERLCGAPVVSVRACSGGANNRVYRIATADGTFALKSYKSSEPDDRDRLGHEFDGLRFLKAAGVGAALPAAIAVDRAARCALYEWIDGAPVSRPGVADIGAVLELLAGLHAVRIVEGAATLPLATQAVVSFGELRRQLDDRLQRLLAVVPDERELGAFLAAEFEPELRRRIGGIRRAQPDAGLATAARTLSPADLGFHNALRRPDGSLAFIDFEYFGWDDPVKLTADFLWHPAMQLDAPQRAAFLAGAIGLYGNDPGFRERLERYFPLYGLRWTLIVLNEFLPQVWERRAFAGKGTDRNGTKARQLLKARALLSVVRGCTEGKIPL